jgi:pimeloyl-ACP methyl ester carboxylesterase
VELRSGLTVHVAEHGEGDPLLLVHGYMTSSYSWRYVLEPLGRRFRVIAPDLPGNGRSAPAPGRPQTAAALGTLIGELQEALKIQGCPVVGNSLGGYLCMQRALADPAAFARVAAIHPPGFPELRLRAAEVALHVPGVRAAMSWWIRRDPERWAHRNVHYRDETLKSREETGEYGRPLSTREGVYSFLGALDDTLDPSELGAYVKVLRRRRDAGERFPVPLLLAYAREDPLVPPSTGPKLAELVPDAEFRWLENTSHFAQVDTPVQVSELLIDFLTR